MTYVDPALRPKRRHNGPAWARLHLWRGCEAPGCDVNPGVLHSRYQQVLKAARCTPSNRKEFLLLQPRDARAWLRARGFAPSQPLGECDHIVPLWNGGDNEEKNLQLLCRPCHKTKTRDEAGQRRRAPKHRTQIADYTGGTIDRFEAAEQRARDRDGGL